MAEAEAKAKGEGAGLKNGGEEEMVVTSKTRGKKRRATAKEKEAAGEEEEIKEDQAGIEKQYEKLKSVPLIERLQPLRSHIHGWGLFSKIAIRAGEMIIEYCGELIRTTVSDRREQNYENSGIGSCYMFR